MLRTYQPREWLLPTVERFLPAAVPRAELSFPLKQIGKRFRQSVELPLKDSG